MLGVGAALAAITVIFADARAPLCFYPASCFALIGTLRLSVIVIIDGFRVALPILRSGYLLSVNGFVCCCSLVLLCHGLSEGYFFIYNLF
jgi:hypothetical protein